LLRKYLINLFSKFEAMKVRTFLTLTALAMMASGLIMLGTGSSRGLAQQRPPPPAVTVAPVEQREIIEWDEFTGRTEPVEMVEVRPRVSGYIQEVRFQS